MDAEQDSVPRWLLVAPVMTVALTLVSIGQLSFHAPTRTLSSRGGSLWDSSTLGPAPRVVAVAPRHDRASVAVSSQAPPPARLGSGLVERLPGDGLLGDGLLGDDGTPDLLAPPPMPAVVLTFPLTGFPIDEGYDPVADAPPLDLLKPVWQSLGGAPEHAPMGLPDELIVLSDLEKSEIVVLAPSTPRWWAGSPVERWRALGLDGVAAAERAGHWAATLLNHGSRHAAAALEAGYSLAAEWRSRRLAAGVIHSPPGLARPVVAGPGDRLAMTVSPLGPSSPSDEVTSDDLPSDEDNRVVDDNTTPAAVGPGVDGAGAEGAGRPWPGRGEGEQADRLATPTTLLEQVRLLMAEPATSMWAVQVEAALDAALAVRPNDVEGFASVSRELRRLALEGSDLAELVDTQRAAVLLRRACYGIFRRLAAWDLAVRIESRRSGPELPRPPLLARHGHSPPNGDRWERIARCLSGRPTSFLACAGGRGAWRTVPVLTRASFETRIAAATRAAAGSSPLRLVSRLEAYERSRNPGLACLLAREARALRASDEPIERRLGERLDSQYRNANVRIAIARELLERLLPQEGVRRTRLNDRVLGAEVRGVASTESRLSLRLTPDEALWRVGLEAEGRVQTNTESTTGPVVLRSRGLTRFEASKSISVDHTGLRVEPARCRAVNQTRLVGVSSRVDAVPLIGRVVRKRAGDRFTASRPQVRRRAERQVERRVAQSLDAAAADAVGQLRRRYEADVLRRAELLGLPVVPIEVRTTDRRLVTRLRLAASDQLGSHTPRTRAPGDSLASVQLHESALNNAAEGLGLAGERFTAESLRRRLADQLIAPSFVEAEAEDTPNLEFRFADEQPLSIAIGDGAARLVLAIAEMRLGRSRYRDFRVHARYEPRPVGAAAIVQRTGALEIEGRLRAAGRLKLHGVFGRVLREDRPLTLLAPPEGDDRFDGLMITQMVMDDGWLGLALGPTGGSGSAGERVAIAGRYLR